MRLAYEDLIARDQASLGIICLKDENLGDSGSLPSPEVIVREIFDDLEAALGLLRLISGDLAGPGRHTDGWIELVWPEGTGSRTALDRGWGCHNTELDAAVRSIANGQAGAGPAADRPPWPTR